MTNPHLKSLRDQYLSYVLKPMSIIFQHVLVSFLVFRVFVGQDSLALRGGPADFGKMIDGTANRPFVLRTLVPSTIRLIRDMLPESLKNHIISFLQTRSWFIPYLRSDRVFEYSIALALSFFFFLGFSLVLRRLAKHFYPSKPFEQHIAAIVGTLILPLFFVYYHYVYDPGTVFLFSFGVLLVVEERLIPMLAFFPILVVHKETSVLLILVFIVRQARNMPITKMMIVSTVMGVIWLSLRILIGWIFRANPRSFLESHLFDHNLRLFASPIQSGFALLVGLLFAALISYDWRSKDEFLRWGFFAVFIPLFLFSIFFGYVDELRQFYEAVPFVALLIAPSISKLAGLEAAHR